MISAHNPNPLIKFLGLSLLVILSPILVPLLVIVIVGYATEIVFMPAEWRFKRKMRAKGRFLPRKELAVHLSAGHADTLIVDAITAGWGIARVWWVPGDILAEAPPRPPKMKVPRGAELSEEELLELAGYRFSLWCWDRYLNPEDGRATLIAVWHGRKLAESLAERFPQISLVYCSSWTRSWKVGKGEKKPTQDVEHPLWDYATDG